MTTLNRLRRKDPRAFSEIASLSLRAGTRGPHLARLGNAAGVIVKPVTTPTLDEMVHDPEYPALHIALVRVTFSDPAKKGAYYGNPYPWAHYVLVLDVKDGQVVVADPHPYEHLRGLRRFHCGACNFMMAIRWPGEEIPASMLDRPLWCRQCRSSHPAHVRPHPLAPDAHDRPMLVVKNADQDNECDVDDADGTKDNSPLGGRP